MEQQSHKPYPIALTQLGGARCVVIGGGEVARRKVGALLESGADVLVVSPELHPALAALRDAGEIQHAARPYQPGDLSGALLAIAATDSRQVNTAVAAEARSERILLNVADDAAGSSFHTLAAVRRGPVLLAASTGGESPALAAHLRRKLEHTFGPEYGVLAERLGQLRRELGPSLSPAVRARIWRALATDNVLELARSRDRTALDRYIEAVIAELAEPTT